MQLADVKLWVERQCCLVYRRWPDQVEDIHAEWADDEDVLMWVRFDIFFRSEKDSELCTPHIQRLLLDAQGEGLIDTFRVIPHWQRTKEELEELDWRERLRKKVAAL